ncbi:receptor-type tyrosine-protein phosphatase N2 [Patella vulgata]|uniref:receptor-type tyrosine-protein phosphatase N2 n=1 Tax=Patella vulgata TaxID=6465 RepID=UPI0024A86EF0|nr:receptor-type tyrosine-protein phosphatase N2 [Patella vulgata]
MKDLTSLLYLTAFIFSVTVNISQGYRSGISKPFPLGTIGCLVANVCGPEEVCDDDKLFGSCRSIGRISLGVTYDLSTTELEQVEAELQQLKDDGFTWSDAFTQCILQNTLLAFARSESINLKEFCEFVLTKERDSEWSNDARNEIAAVLEKLLESSEGDKSPHFQSRADDSNFSWDDLQTNSDKRDEIVEVHKYFDQSKGLKRDSYSEYNDIPYNYLSNNSPDTEVESSRLGNREFENPEEIQAYLSLLDRLSNSAKSSEFDQSAYPQSQTKSNAEEVGLEASMSGGTGGHGYEDSLDESENSDDINIPSQSDSEDLTEGDDEDREVKEDEYLSISPPDEKALEELLAGNIDPHDIEMNQLKRLMNIVEIMVKQLDDEEQQETRSSEEDILTPDSDTAIEVPVVVPEETVITANGKEPVVINSDSDIPVDKKAVEKEPIDENPEDTEAVTSARDVVDMRYGYIVLDQNVDEVTGGRFLQQFFSVINLPFSDLDEIQTSVNKITFRVQPNPKFNASMVAAEADDEKIIEQLQQATGLKITKAGIGKNTNQVELKKDENKYVVLTFILVGCIAGILLAVVVIYLIKRQSRSKEKLAELADNAEGNEASKDYQDLCRQRMQSKSSEKPEPLHAASRIGSVSDQVRSPSSRSSTSSWSEEPVPSNMDISTGHIVLSYMEDHLNNQDRLDTEWEALSGYEAEPSSTKVATDASNMRKNRYGDILPYDHSRVVLSSAANVSNSDYINANFITDHDPRNPAFIVTQSPLPHTVADFWQMVWEQGSVVIVMLTKLTENGTAMCHRYWPEEGSDLYHIYEVHLVSEHIWCDDYLVRSFYLKNLQTNETRTVTQFHFLTWPNLGVPGSIKALLDYRRKVNKSFRGRSCPIVVHCSDGCDRSGTYILIDMVLNRMAKGAKEIDMAATLEHIRDQRMSMVKTKEQFQFALASVAEEVHAILKALPQ